MAAKKTEAIGLEKALRNIAQRYSINQVFDDFLKMTVCAFTIGFMEEEYKKIAGRYDEHELKMFAGALAEMTEEYHREVTVDGWADVVGDLFETVNSASQASRSGQFFTPKSVCNLMSKITHVESDPIPNTVNDCACGSSRNLLAHKALKPAHRHVFYVAQDLDERCILMSVINFVMHGMKGVIIHMDTLRMKVYGGYRIYLPEIGLFAKPMTVAQCNYYLFEHREIADAEPIKIELSPVPEQMKQAILKGQLSLF